ncbi:MAG: hypothetical protein IJ071_07365 [Ruminococcus sp.]|nr:hypothetical protein [Ruminococcus sp.]
MDFIYRLPAAVIFLAAIMYIGLAARFKKDVYRRLEEKHTHKEMRALKAEINSRRAEFPFYQRLFMEPMFAEREFLEEGMLPEKLCRIRESVPWLGVLAGAAVLFGKRAGLPGIVPLIPLAAELILLVSYFPAEKKNAQEVLPKILKQEAKSRIRNGCDPKTGAPFTPKQKKIVRQAYVIRYGIIAAVPFLALSRDLWYCTIISGAIIIASAFYTGYHLRYRTHALFCAEQMLSHRPATPLRHSKYIGEKAVKDFRFVCVVESLTGTALLVLGLFEAVPGI